MATPVNRPQYPDLGQARFNQAVLVATALFATMDREVSGLLLEPMKLELHLSDVQLGLASATATYAAYGLLAIPAGILADRTRRVSLLIIAVSLFTGGTMLTGLSHSVPALVFAKCLIGAAGALSYPAAMSLLADNFAPDRRAFGTASYGIGQSVGSGIGILAGGFGYSALIALVAAHPAALWGVSPWRAVILTGGAVGLILIPALLAMREPSRMEIGEKTANALVELWAYRRLLIPLFIGVKAIVGMDRTVTGWISPALMRLYRLTPGEFVTPMTIILIGGSIAALFAASQLTNLARKNGSNRLMLVVAAIAAAVSIPCTFLADVPDARWLAVIGSLYVLACGIATAIPVIAINMLIPNELRGLCMGLYVILCAIAAMVGAPLVGLVSGLLGGEMMLGQAIAIVCAPLAATAALSFWQASRVLFPAMVKA